MRKLILIAVCCSTFVSSCWAKEPVVPDWFRPDPKKLYAIFDAWRNLNSTEAALYWGSRCVCAGVLHDSGASQLAIAS